MNNYLKTFGFATVSSKGYVDQTAGLILNLRTFYPDTTIVVCALDSTSFEAFSSLADPSLLIVSGETVWGATFWRNISARMDRAERAFATKAALSAWFLEKVAASLLLLDSDLLFLDRVDDLLNLLSKHPAMLVSGRHGIQSWNKSQRFGFFSAGVLGLTNNIIEEVKIWKAHCFENCSAIPLSGLYYEQKYLDSFVNIPNIAVVHDPGINISQTFLKRSHPYRDSEGRWCVSDGTRIRIFHASRSSDQDFSLYKDKQHINHQGLNKITTADDLTIRRQSRGAESMVATMFRRIAIGKFINYLLESTPIVLRKTMAIYRTLTIRELPLRERITETFLKKSRLLKTLHAESSSNHAQLKDD